MIDLIKEDFATKIVQLESKVHKHKETLMALQARQPNFQKFDLESLEFSYQHAKGGGWRTCREILAAYPAVNSGMYWIDPDGQGVGDDAIYFHCDMTTGIPIIVQYFSIIITYHSTIFLNDNNSHLKFKMKERLRFFTIASHVQTLAIALNPDVIREKSTITQLVNKFQLWLNCHKNVINPL